MQDSDTRLVRESFALLAPMADAAAAAFYPRVFERAPAARSLFRGDMVVQGRRLMAMIGAAVADLDDLSALTHTLHTLGQRHVGYEAPAKRPLPRRRMPPASPGWPSRRQHAGGPPQAAAGPGNGGLSR